MKIPAPPVKASCSKIKNKAPQFRRVLPLSPDLLKKEIEYGYYPNVKDDDEYGNASVDAPWRKQSLVYRQQLTKIEAGGTTSSIKAIH